MYYGIKSKIKDYVENKVQLLKHKLSLPWYIMLCMLIILY